MEEKERINLGDWLKGRGGEGKSEPGWALGREELDIDPHLSKTAPGNKCNRNGEKGLEPAGEGMLLRKK